jgi:osmotically-inducible protein OsmY
MSARMTIFAGGFIVFAFLGTEGFAQDSGPVDPGQGTTVPQGHTLDELGRGIKDEAKKVGKKLNEVGQDIKVEASHVSSGVVQKFESVKSDVHKLPIQHRIYARIHWDKLLLGAMVEVHMLRDGVVLLRGTVPTEAARRHAVELASDSVGVSAVINELTVPAKAISAQTALPPKPSARR